MLPSRITRSHLIGFTISFLGDRLYHLQTEVRGCQLCGLGASAGQQCQQLQTSQATADNAIVTSIAGECLWDVSLDIPHVDFMPGLDSWDDLAFLTLQQEPGLRRLSGCEHMGEAGSTRSCVWDFVSRYKGLHGRHRFVPSELYAV